MPSFNYTLGFVLVKSEEAGGPDSVLLLKKKKPLSQAGKYNGIGGRIEEHESPEACMIREAHEEANLPYCDDCRWTFVGTLFKPDSWIVYVAYSFIPWYSKILFDIPKSCDEGELLWTPVNALPENTMTNVRWIIPFIQNHREEGQIHFRVHYKSNAYDDNTENYEPIILTNTF